MTIFAHLCYNRPRYWELIRMKMKQEQEDIVKQVEMNYQLFLQLIWQLRQVRKMTLSSLIDNVNLAYELKRECDLLSDTKLNKRTETMSIAIDRFLKLYVGLYDLYLDVQEENKDNLDFTVEEYLSLLRNDKKKQAYEHNLQSIENCLAKIDFKEYVLKEKENKKKFSINKRQIRRVKEDYLKKLQTIRKKLSDDLKNGLTFDFYYRYKTGYYTRSLKRVEKSFLNQATLEQVSSPLKEKAIRREKNAISKTVMQLDNVVEKILNQKVVLKNGEKLSLDEIDLLNANGYYDMIDRMPDAEVDKVEKRMRKLRKKLNEYVSIKKKNRYKMRKKASLSSPLAVVQRKINHVKEDSKVYDKWMGFIAKFPFVSGVNYHYHTCQMIQENGHHLTTKKALQIQKRLKRVKNISFKDNDQDLDTITKLSASCMEKKLDKALYSTNLDREDNYLSLLESTKEYIKFFQEQKSPHKKKVLISLSTLGLVAGLGIASLFRLGNTNSKELTVESKNTIEADTNNEDLTFGENTFEPTSMQITPSIENKTEKLEENKREELESKQRKKSSETEALVSEDISSTGVVSNRDVKASDHVEQVPSAVSNLEVFPLTYLEEFTLQENAKVYSNIHMDEEEGKVPYYDHDVVRQAYKVVFLLDGIEYDVLLSDVELCRQFQNLGAEVIGYLAINDNSKEENGKVNPSLAEGFHRESDVKQLVR